MEKITIIERALLLLLCCLLLSCAASQKKESTISEDYSGEAIEPVLTESSLISSIGEPEQLTSGETDNGIGSYSLEGDKIVFQSNRDGNWQIYELDLSLGSENHLIESESNDENPVYFTDGKGIFIVSDKNGGSEFDRDIYLYNIESIEVNPVTEARGDDWFPVNLTDNKILFLSERDADLDLKPSDRSNSIYSYDMISNSSELICRSSYNFSSPIYYNNENIIVLTPENQLGIYNFSADDLELLTPSTLECGSATLYPEKNYVVFTAKAYNQEKLYVMDISGKALQEIETGLTEIRYPRFSPDYAWLLFSAEVNGNFQMFRMNIAF